VGVEGVVCIGCKYCEGYPDTVPYCTVKMEWILECLKTCEDYEKKE